MTQQQGDRLAVELLCALAQVSRAGFYRHWREMGTARRRNGAPEPAAGSRSCASPLRLSAAWRVVAESWPRDQSQAGTAPDATGQSVVLAQAEVRAGDDELAPRLASISEPGALAGTDEVEPALGGGYHVHPAETELRLSGRNFGCVQPSCHRLVDGGSLGEKLDAGRRCRWRWIRVACSLAT